MRNVDHDAAAAIIHRGGNDQYPHHLTPATLTSPIRRPAWRVVRGRGQLSGYAALFDYTAEFGRRPKALQRLRRSGSSPHAKTIGKDRHVAQVMVRDDRAGHQVIVDRVLVERDVGLLHLIILAMIVVLAFSVLGMLLQRFLFSFVAVRMDSAGLAELLAPT
jgi:hypothetical protein